MVSSQVKTELTEVCNFQVAAADSCPVGYFSQGCQWRQVSLGRRRAVIFASPTSFVLFVGSSVSPFWEWRVQWGKEADDGLFHQFAKSLLPSIPGANQSLQIRSWTWSLHIAPGCVRGGLWPPWVSDKGNFAKIVTVVFVESILWGAGSGVQGLSDDCEALAWWWGNQTGWNFQ